MVGVAADDDCGPFMARQFVAKAEEVRSKVHLFTCVEHGLADAGVQHADNDGAVCFENLLVRARLELFGEFWETRTWCDVGRALLWMSMVSEHLVPWRTQGALARTLVQPARGITDEVQLELFGWDMEGVRHEFSMANRAAGADPWGGSWGATEDELGGVGGSLNPRGTSDVVLAKRGQHFVQERCLGEETGRDRVGVVVPI